MHSTHRKKNSKKSLSGAKAATRRSANASALAAFGVDPNAEPCDSAYRDIRVGSGPTIFTIGYERRDGEDLVSSLKDAGVTVLVDVRERPFSRKPDFREKALRALCEDSGIGYQCWKRLGSTGHQRDQLKETGNFSEFKSRFRQFAKRGRSEELAELADFSETESVALICYERAHEECHRSIVADLVADINDATITAIC